MGTIRRRSAYQYQAQVRRKGYPAQSKTFATREEAELWISETEAGMKRGIWRSTSEAERTTLREALDRYLAEVTPQKKGAHRERNRIIQLQNSPLGSRYLSDLRGMDLAQYRDQRLTEVGPSTVTRELAAISHLFTIARKEWGMDYLANPAQSVRNPRQPPGRDRRLEGDEEDRLLDQLHGELMAIVIFAIETGMRRGEIMGMKWEQVRRDSVMLPDTKNGSSRVVPLSTKARAVLAELPRRIDGRVWGMYIDDVTRNFQSACQRAGIEGMVFHSLRHEATSRFFERGLTIMEVAAITGHKSLAMLQRYSHLSVSTLAQKLG